MAMMATTERVQQCVAGLLDAARLDSIEASVCANRILFRGFAAIDMLSREEIAAFGLRIRFVIGARDQRLIAAQQRIRVAFHVRLRFRNAK